MPGLAQLLRRFRFTGVPGPPAVAGIPGDRRVALEAELAPVFALLDEVQREAAQIEAVAAHRAASQQARAGAQAERIVADSREGADAERAAALASVLAGASCQGDELLAAARAEGDRITRAAELRLASLAGRVAEAVLRTSVAE